jgi:hypothetical protein
MAGLGAREPIARDGRLGRIRLGRLVSGGQEFLDILRRRADELNGVDELMPVHTEALRPILDFRFFIGRDLVLAFRNFSNRIHGFPFRLFFAPERIVGTRTRRSTAGS